MSFPGEGRSSHQGRRAARRIAVLDFQLQDCLSRLEVAERDLEIIRAGLAHVLRSRLPAAERLAQRRQPPSPPSQAGCRPAPQLGEELRRIERFLAQLLLFADVDRRRMTVRSVDLTALAAAAVERLRSSEPRPGVAVQIAAGILVEADAYLFGTLLTALIEDAWRRLRRGRQAQGGIHVGWTQMGSDTVCFVRDNGEGFDPGEAQRLIGPGGRTSRGSRRWSGLGLILARRIVERHGGRLWVDACPEIGATVYFTVAPSAVAAAREPARAAAG